MGLGYSRGQAGQSLPAGVDESGLFAALSVWWLRCSYWSDEIYSCRSISCDTNLCPEDGGCLKRGRSLTDPICSRVLSPPVVEMYRTRSIPGARSSVPTQPAIWWRFFMALPLFPEPRLHGEATGRAGVLHIYIVRSSGSHRLSGARVV